MAFGSNPTTGTQGSLSANQFPLSSVATPNTANGDLTALEGGPVSTDGNGNKTAPASMYVKDGSDVTQGAKADTAITDATTTNTKMSFVKGLVKIFADIWDSVNHRIRIDGSGVIQPISGSVTVNTISNYANESGGNLAALKTDADTLVTNTTGLATQVTLSAAKTDLDTIVTNTNKIPASPATEGGHLAAIDTSTAASKTDLDTLAGIVASNKASVQDIEQAGYVSASTPPSTTNAGSDTSYTFSSQVNRVILENHTSANVYYAFDTAASAGSLKLVPGSTIVYPKKCTVLHLFTSASQNINGTVDGNIVVLGAL